MALSANNSAPDPKPTGDLEHLFQQKFADAEVTPRASVWEQLDHELLVQQNDTYRRRLLGYRWAAAASLLLLAGGGTWLTFHTFHDHAAAQLASTPTAGSSRPNGASTATASSSRGRASRLRLATPPAHQRSAAEVQTNRSVIALDNAVTASAGTLAAVTEASATGASVGLSGRRSTAAGRRYEQSLGLNRGRAGAGTNLAASRQPGTASVASAGYGTIASSGAMASTGFDGLAARPASLLNSGSVARPNDVPPSVAVPAPAALAAAGAAEAPAETTPEQTTLNKARRWKFAAAYAALTFNPNANFSQTQASSAQANVSAAPRSSFDAYETAAAEYEQHMQPGPGQRFTVTAEYALNQHWSVQTGLSGAQQEATTQTSWYFLDGKSAAAASYAPAANGAAMRPAPLLRTVSYRYRTAGVPAGVRYVTTEKQGWSLYAKLGAAVSVLLGSRTELQGMPEATRVYTLSSSDSPYRKVLATLHGSTGVRYRPAAGNWSLALGPDLEAGLNTLNNSPTQGLLRQGRPYAFGMEASMEFGAKPAVLVK